MWAFRARSLSELTADATSAVVATVTQVKAGKPIRGDDESQPETPTQLIGFQVKHRVWGRVPSRFTLFKTGSEVLWGDGDPPYAVGERYLLFIRERKDAPGLYIPVGPDGRLRVLRGGLLESVIHGRIANLLAGLTTREVGPIVRRSRG